MEEEEQSLKNFPQKAEEFIAVWIMNTPPVTERNMSRQVQEVFVPVSQKYMGRIIGTRGSNVKQIAQETRTTIKTCNGENFGKGPGFLVIGISRDCKDAERAIRSYI